MLPKLFAAILVYCFVILSVSLSINYTPAGAAAVKIFAYRVHFQFFMLLPALAILVWAVIKSIRESTTEFEEHNATTVLALIVYYCLYIVLFTGGISGSPLSSLVGIVPLLASTFIGAPHRIRLLLFFVAGAVLVGILSTLQLFNPPQTYPNGGGWEFTGHANNIIAMVVISTGIMIEVLLLLYKKHHGERPAAAPISLSPST